MIKITKDDIGYIGFPYAILRRGTAFNRYYQQEVSNFFVDQRMLDSLSSREHALVIKDKIHTGTALAMYLRESNNVMLHTPSSLDEEFVKMDLILSQIGI